VISSFSPVEAATGDTVTITGTDFDATSKVTFGNTPASSFVVKSDTKLLAVVGNGSSGEISVTTATGAGYLGGFNYIYKLPPNNFSVAATSATCKGNADGSITVNAVQSAFYEVAVTGNGINKGYSFNNSVTVDSLAAGTYNVCLTIYNQPGFSSCYTIIVTEPKDLSVYSVVNSNDNTVNMHMDGGELYNITLNGKLYLSTTDSTATISLPEGKNDIVVSTDRFCQGVVEKLVSISSKLTPYPNPFQGPVNINLGNKTVGKVTIEVHGVADGKQVYFKQYINMTGILQVDLSGLANGIYVFHIAADNADRVFKIVKK